MWSTAKLTFYASLKNHVRENLTSASPRRKHVKAYIACLRSSAHDLKIERGKFIYANVPRAKRLYKGCTKAVQRLYKGCTKAVQRLYKGCTKAVQRLYKGCTKAVQRLYKGCTKAVQRLYKGCSCLEVCTGTRVHRRLSVNSTCFLSLQPLLKELLTRLELGTISPVQGASKLYKKLGAFISTCFGLW